MNKEQLIEKFIKNPKASKILVISGLAGMLILALSSMFSSDDSSESPLPSAAMTSYEYCEWLEEKIAQTVDEITGEEGAEVLVTLETGVEYIYATEQKKDNSNTGQSDGGKFSESGSTAETYITVTDGDGNEAAVVLTELTPKIRGVSVVCRGGQKAEVVNAVTAALATALNISSENISVTGSGIY